MAEFNRRLAAAFQQQAKKAPSLKHLRPDTPGLHVLAAETAGRTIGVRGPRSSTSKLTPKGFWPVGRGGRRARASGQTTPVR